MARKTERVAYPLTFLLKKEGDLWAAVTPEIGIASCGDNLDHARWMLKSAIRATYRVTLEKGWMHNFWKPLNEDEIEEFKTEVPGEIVSESHVMIVTTPVGQEQPVKGSDVRIDFVRSENPAEQPSALAAA